jgi:hypothetical protein
MAQVVEHLSRKLKALCFPASTTKNKKQKQKLPNQKDQRNKTSQILYNQILFLF